MDIQKLLNPQKCTCGKVHSCDIKHVLIKPGAVNEINALCGDYKSIVLVADSNTYKICGDRVAENLGEKLETKLVFETKGFLVPNEEATKRLDEAISEQTDLVLGVGSGVIQDLCKYASFKRDLPYYIVATAPSMDGYASSGAAMIFDNMKITENARVPEAIIGDVDILKDAPMEMIQSGYGDIIGKLSCLNDWKLSVVVNDEYFCQYVYDLTMQAVDSIKDEGEKLLSRDPNAVQKLMEALIIVGIAMAYVGNSRPASGSEHHLSHFFEVTGIMEDSPYLMHGTDVLFSSVYTSKIREKIAEISVPEFHKTSAEDSWKKDVTALYKMAADGVIALQERLGTYKNDKSETYKSKWAEIRKTLKEAASSEEILKYTKSIGLDLKTFTDIYGEEKIKNAIFYSKDLKDRYTVLWLNYSLFYEGL